MVTLADGGVAGFTTRRVAEEASTSVSAVYELFGDRAGLLREMFFDGFRRLGARFERLRETDDPRDDVLVAVAAYRRFVTDNPQHAQLMFAHAFSDFDPGPDEREAGAAVRRLVVRRVQRCIDAEVLHGDPIDIAHVLFALAQGLALQESGGWLGTTKASVNRRWDLAFAAALDGLSG